ncbi:MAG: LysR family transcriptional regulator [Alphaproteobacteria bacterium]|jgi:DNA-binding transcriptional LysR family regulator|nr:LysR family transcriptional regulator [Alphaproteobacteria bacterium]MBP9877762.1 LysR family transcriptional regulator [Alphaproteobacteria bacterium]
MRKNPKKISIDQISAFTKVAEAGSIKNASKLLEVSASAVSTAMANLESSIGEQLFIRHQNGLDLTAQGRRLYEKCLECLVKYDEIRDAFVPSDEIAGDIRISTWHGVASFVLCEPIIDFVKNVNEHIFLDVISDNIDRRFEDYHCDVAIRPLYKNRSDLIQEKLFSMQFRAYASKSYIEKHGCPETFEDLDNHRLLSNSYVDAEKILFADWHLFVNKDNGEMRKPFLTINSSIGLVMCCGEGLGIGTFPSYYKRYIKEELVEIFPDHSPTFFDFYYIYPAASKNSKRVKLFGDFLKTRLLDSENQ